MRKDGTLGRMGKWWVESDVSSAGFGGVMI